MTNKDIKEVLYRIIDVIDYMDRISKLPDCNDCAIASTCGYAPELGQEVRINCPHHVKVE